VTPRVGSYDFLTRETQRIVCSQCHRDRWLDVRAPVPEPFVCTGCRMHNEIPVAPRPRPAA